jgi:mycothiol maleylpyruvate isomerase-like protein
MHRAPRTTTILIRPRTTERLRLRSARILARVSQSNPDRELIAEEERLWTELHDLVDSMPADKVEEPGYFAEGWSAKDLVAHIGSWLAEAGVVLEQIRAGTYRPEEIDIDAMNARFSDAMRDVPFPDVRAQAFAARNRMLRAWRSLPEGSPEADRWIRKSGPEHYAEHLPRLREWVGELAR